MFFQWLEMNMQYLGS